MHKYNQQEQMTQTFGCEFPARCLKTSILGVFESELPRPKGVSCGD